MTTKTKKYYRKNRGRNPNLVWDSKKKQWWDFKLKPWVATEFSFDEWKKKLTRVNSV
jgi:hypothetical protein